MIGSAATEPLWASLAPRAAASRPPLRGADRCDVAIIGAGFTGLWTAFYLQLARPDWDIRVVEARTVGHGASGRNGGWCSSILPMSLRALAATHGNDAARAMQLAMQQTVTEVGRVIATESIDCGWQRGGYVHAARNSAQLARLQAELAELDAFAIEGSHWLEPAAVDERIRIPGVVGGIFHEHCAALDPGRLVRGLAEVVEARGVTICEESPVRRCSGGEVVGDHGSLQAGQVVIATEAYGVNLPGRRRRLVPVYSLMVATEPLGAEVWKEIGWAGRETFNDARHLIVYAQRTEDDRIAFGGRGAPYHFGSRIDPAFDCDDSVHRRLVETLHELFPAARHAAITNRWGGPLGVPRDWHAGCGQDDGGTWSASGYVGDGVATSNLAGRTVAGLIAGVDDDLSRLAWVGHRSRNWEPEPVRWVSVRAALGLTRLVDAAEDRGRRLAPASWLLDRLTGG